MASPAVHRKVRESLVDETASSILLVGPFFVRDVILQPAFLEEIAAAAASVRIAVSDISSLKFTDL